MTRQSIPQQPFNLGAKQRGATLIVGLVFLLLLAIVGMAAIDVTTVDVKVVANSKDRQMAFNEAESQLFQAGRQIRNAPRLIQAGDAKYQPGTFRLNNTWWSTDANWASVTAAGDADYVIEQPQYRPELTQNGVSALSSKGTGQEPRAFEYPVISKALGPGGAEVVLSMRYVKKVQNDAIQ